MTRTAQVAFAVLVLATFGAFFAAQRLKRSPPVIPDFTATPLFSPNRDGRKDRAAFSFLLQRADEVTVAMVDASGERVRTLAEDRDLDAFRRLSLRWDGRDDAGEEVPDGRYAVRIALRREGRTVLLPRSIVKDTEPPRPLVTSVGPERDPVPRPELLPRADGRPARVTFRAPGRQVEVEVYRTDVEPARLVRGPVDLSDDTTRWEWDGTRDDGRRVGPGTYAVNVRSRDAAGNIGSALPSEPPAPAFGEGLPGRGGITVRYLAVQPSAVPARAGERATLAVTSPGERFTWTVRRVGSPDVRDRGGPRPGTDVVNFRAPGGRSGLYLFTARTATRTMSAPFAVQSQQDERVLVVLPVATWQGRNPVDDDGDGRPDTLDAGLDARLGRPYAGNGGLPPQIVQGEAPLLAHLDRSGREYDLTTDVALARGEGPQLGDRPGVILAGDTRWLAPRAGSALRAFVRGGGTLLSVGTSSLRRTVRVTPRRLLDPTPATDRDLFGARLAGVVREPVTITNSVDRIDLFEGTAGTFGGFTAYEETEAVGDGARLAASGSTEDGERTVIVAARVGRGLVVRPGLPEFSDRLSADDELAGLMERTWTLLARR